MDAIDTKDDLPKTEYVDIRLVSESNQREHWAVKAKRVKSHRRTAYFSVSPNQTFPVTVLLIRVFGPMRRKFDDDNLSSSFKAVRDGIAQRMGINDNDPRVSWEYDQQRGGRDCIGIRITPR